MSWSIEEELTTYPQTNANPVIRMNIVVDDVASLPAVSQSDFTFCMGSRAKNIDNGKTYILNGSGNWIVQPSDNAWENVYTKTEIDSMFAALNILTKADLFRGEQIVANTDVNTITNYGVYYCADGTTAATLSNCPITTTGFIMIVYSTGNRVRLFYGVSATNPRIFIQAYTGSQWRTIKEATLV